MAAAAASSSSSSDDSADDKGWALVGTRCRLFPAAPNFVDTSLLLPWQGNAALLMDRFDARLLLDDEREFRKKKFKLGRPVVLVGVSRDGVLELDDERDLQRERVRGLPAPPHTVKVLSTAARRAARHAPQAAAARHAAVDQSVVEHRRGLTWTSVAKQVQATEQPTLPLVDPGLLLPSGIDAPTSRAAVEVIARTATFVHAQGPQMEVLMRAKQAGNTKFSFMTPGAALYPFYRHIVARLAEGYKTGFEPKEEPLPAQPTPLSTVEHKVPAKASVVRLMGSGGGSLVGGGDSDSSSNSSYGAADNVDGIEPMAAAALFSQRAKGSVLTHVERKRAASASPPLPQTVTVTKPRATTWLLSVAPTVVASANVRLTSVTAAAPTPAVPSTVADSSSRKRPKLAFSDSPSVPAEVGYPTLPASHAVTAIAVPTGCVATAPSFSGAAGAGAAAAAGAAGAGAAGGEAHEGASDVRRHMTLVAQKVVASRDATLLQTLTARQATNPQFAFLNPWHPLHPQFQAILQYQYSSV